MDFTTLMRTGAGALPDDDDTKFKTTMIFQ